MEAYKITERAEYDYAVSRGFHPLIDEHFEIEHSLRRDIQKEMFGKNDASGNCKFYQYVWRHSLHYCEECSKPLMYYSSAFVSHILSRGAHPEMAHDPRNANILCLECHERWEHATTRKGMRIEGKNNQTIERLRNEYNNN